MLDEKIAGLDAETGLGMDRPAECGSLDEWLRRRARSNQVSGASRTYVVAEGERVAGYYCLASSMTTILSS